MALLGKFKASLCGSATSRSKGTPPYVSTKDQYILALKNKAWPIIGFFTSSSIVPELTPSKNTFISRIIV